MLYELRLYAVQIGRSADIERRMLVEVPALFAEHGLRAVGHWRVIVGPDLPAFVYIMIWRDAAEREAGWSRFYADERWWAIRAHTNAGSELVEHYGLWLMKPLAACVTQAPHTTAMQAGEVHEMVLYHVAIGGHEAINACLRSAVLPAIEHAGGRLWGGFEMIAGPRVPALVLIVAWPGFEACRSWRDTLATGAAHSFDNRGITLLGRSDARLLQPVPAPREAAA